VPHHDHFPVPEERLPKKKFGFEIYFRYWLILLIGNV
jgi:hypothetical protein